MALAGALAALLCAGTAARAGDILRGGASAQAPGAAPVYGATAATTAQERANANDTLARATAALQALRAMQAAAQKIAQGGANNLGADPNHPGNTLPNVPNGLVTGGLVPDSGLASPGVANPVTTWTGASTPTQTTSNGQTTVNITQTAQQAILNWQTFNIGKNTTLNIDQSAGGANVSEWTAFNIIHDPSDIPSQILGAIQALGQVYVINQNGIIFGGASQVNTHTLVASSLPINPTLLSQGLLNNPTYQFLFSTITTDPSFKMTSTTTVYQLEESIAPGSTPVLSYTNTRGSVDPNGALVAGVDYTIDYATSQLTFTTSGLSKIARGDTVTVTYTAAAGNVTVQAGASIYSPASDAQVGGRVALIGPNVTNEGTISTPDGQTILAAGYQVGMVASSDPTLRGLDTYVGAVYENSGVATNTGEISAPGGDIWMTGANVDQMGAIDSTTTVDLNGRIDLVANYNALSSGGQEGVAPFLPQNAGEVELGPGSITEILPDLSSALTVTGPLLLQSQINMQGESIYLAPNSLVLAPNANVSLNAGTWYYTVSGAIQDDVFVNSYPLGQIYLDTGAEIDVQGSTDVSDSVTQNIVAAQLLGAQLEDDPQQRDGILRGQTVNVDLLETGVYDGVEWVGTPLADLSGYAALVEHTVGQLTTNGGAVSMTAGDSVVMQPGSTVNVSGGWIDYQGGMVQTTKLISNGEIYDISQALPDMVFTGILNGFTVDDTKWGVSESFGTPLVGGPYYEAGYIEGGNGGSISITAPSMALDGNLTGNTVAGARQQTVLPESSALSLNFEALNAATLYTQGYSPMPPAIIFESGVTLPPVGAFGLDGSGNPLPIPVSRQDEVVLSPDLVSSDGFGTLTVDNGDGNITVPANVNLTVPAGFSSEEHTAAGAVIDNSSGSPITLSGGDIVLAGANIDIEGSITAPGGDLSFTAYNISPYVALSLTPPSNPGRGTFTLGPAASLNTAGLVVNDSPGSPIAFTQPVVTNGGEVTIEGYNAYLDNGSAINVSGGIYVNPSGKASYGAGGGIVINAGQDPGVASVFGGQLLLGAAMSGYSGGAGGSLGILAPLIQIGGNTLLNGDTDGETLWLQPGFFDQGGFASFTLTGLGEATGQPNQYLPGVLIAPNTVIAPEVENWLAETLNPAGGNIVLAPVLQPAGVRTPVSLTFDAPGVLDPFLGYLLLRGDFIMDAGAVIQTDPQTNSARGVSINANTVTVLGSIIAPGGSISIKGGANSTALFTGVSQEVPTVDLGPQSYLSTAGVLLLTPDPSGNNYRVGSVLPGGDITVSGNIVAEQGAVLDVSGATGVLDLSPADSGLANNVSLNGAVVVPTRVDSNGGTITLIGQQELFTDATLIGEPGGPSALGGSLSVSSGQVATLPTPLAITLMVTQQGPVIPASFYTSGLPVIGNPVIPDEIGGSPNYVSDAQGNPLYVLNTSGDPAYGFGHIAVDSFSSGGFSSVALKGTVQFSGPVTIATNESLTVGTAGVIFANAPVTLNAPYVDLGQPFQPPEQLDVPLIPYTYEGAAYSFSPTYGAGNLSVSASLIDIGNLSLQNIGNVNLTANNGDIRGDGTLDVAGNITLTAGQIYPPTEVVFTIAAYDYNSGGVQPGTVTIIGSGGRPLPLSAGGELDIYASVINQGGVLRAPIGTINLGWDGVGTAPVDPITDQPVDAAQQVTLQAGSVTSVSAVDPATGQGIIIPYGINLNGIQWIDPAGTDITAGGVASKLITISGTNVNEQAGATIDISGGGDLYAYRWVSGLGGTVDILDTTTSFAIIPGYQAAYAAYGAYAVGAPNLGGDPGYVNGSLAVGGQIYLEASSGLPAGVYTLLPARYALLPGAFLVTPETGNVTPGAVLNPDGSSIVPGYMFNGLATGVTAQPLFTPFEVDSQAVVQNRAEYDNFYASSFLVQGALANAAAVPRLPIDSGQMVLVATTSLEIQGVVDGQAPAGGLGGQIDISSPLDILIAPAGTPAAPGTLVLDPTELDSFGAESLLIGGIRQTGAGGTTVSVSTNNLAVDNPGAPLTGQDVILAANDSITLDAGAEVESSGAVTDTAQTLILGNASLAGSGDGVLLRVSSDPSAAITRVGVDSQSAQAALANPPVMTIGAGATVSGESVTLDSSYATSLDPTATISGNAVNLNSGQISIQLTNPGPLFAPTAGLVLTDAAVENLESNTQFLSLLSYSSIDVYGTGQVGASTFANLALHTAEIRGFNNGGGVVTFEAENILLDNGAGGTEPGPVAAPDGTLTFNAGTISLGANQVDIDQYADLELDATGGVLAQSTGGLAAQGGLTIDAPVVTGAAASNETITADGAIAITSPGGTPAVTGGLGATLAMTGASITVNGNITLPSGNLTLEATSGDVTVGNLAPATLDAGGISQNFFDAVAYTSGGQINITADAGNVSIGANGIVNVAAQPGGGNGGTVAISAPAGIFTLEPGSQLLGAGGAGGTNGSFSLDAGTIPVDFALLGSTLDAGGFTQSISIRDRNDSSIVIDGSTAAQNFNLSADTGSILVTGTINASGLTGSSINLEANGNVILEAGAKLDASATNFNDAGQGGAVTLEAGDETNGIAPVAAENSGTFSGTGYLDIQAGSEIDLGVAANNAGSAALGDFTGILHLRAPQTPGNTDVQINPINGTINGASAIVVEGYAIFNASSNGSIDGQEAAVYANGVTFAGAAGTTTAGYTNMVNRLFANNAALVPEAVIEPGAEIINPSGDLTLANSWDLSSFRFGPDSAPGDLTLRAAGNIVIDFGASLSDGFDPTQSSDLNHSLWDAPLMTANPLLPANVQSWSYRLVAGADFSAANYQEVIPTPAGSTTGSLLLGEGSPSLPASDNAGITSILQEYYQTIRTGGGSITIDAGGDVQLLNSLATIYTAGTQMAPIANFEVPPYDLYAQNSGLGDYSPQYPVQYSAGGGDVTISAQDDIAHYIVVGSATEQDSSKELPVNWLYRRGAVNSSGQFATSSIGNIESTTWWIDFSNFFEGIGALGGGNVTMIAGRNITNVDAVVPTDAEMTYQTPGGNKLAADQTLTELGGGDLLVKAGNNISGGVYYVERGQGVIAAGNDILTNSTRAALIQGSITTSPAGTPDPAAWMGTTLFLGEGSFDVTAGGDLLLGPVANPFLLPEGLNNNYQQRSYFSTYATTDSVNVSSLTGNVILDDDSDTGAGSLLDWFQNVLGYQNAVSYARKSQPWLSTDETSDTTFSVAMALMPSTLRTTSFSGDINIVGSITLSPSPVGTVQLLADGSINGLQINDLDPNYNEQEWGSALINLSDANPASIPSVFLPISPSTTSVTTSATLFNNFDLLFDDSGSVLGAFGVLQTKDALHSPGLLHAGDPDPVELYADTGDISGLTLYSGEVSRVIAGTDITDVSLYIQNNNPSDISLVAAGQDIIAYDPDSPLREEAQTPGNELMLYDPTVSAPASGSPTAGDIQVAGPGTIEVLAGRNLNLGVGPSNSDGTGVGLTSIGNQANPYLPFAGANIIAGSGMGGSFGLDHSNIDFTAFIAQFLNPATGGAEAARYLPDLATMLDMGGASDADVWNAFTQLQASNPEQADDFALDIFYLVLRDAGRDHNDPSSPDYGNYDEGYDAIAALFPDYPWQGDITLTSREIKTENGGDIDLFAPGGELTVGLQVAGAEALDQGILTVDGGNISIFTNGDVNVGVSRIFTLAGGNEIIWSTTGNIDAGASSKTVQSAPPTQVVVDPQSADVETDLEGIATGGGIGVLDTVAGVPPGDVDLIAPSGDVNAGDAGIRATGNLNIAAVKVLNAQNISVSGVSVGTPAGAAAPNVAGLAAGNTAAGAGSSAANAVTQSMTTSNQPQPQQQVPSIITVEVLGYGGGESMNDGTQEKKPDARRKSPGTAAAASGREAPLAMNADGPVRNASGGDEGSGRQK